MPATRNGHVRLFKGIQVTTSAGAGGTILTKFFPCKGAKFVRCYATSASGAEVAGTGAGFDAGMGDAPTAQNLGGLGYTTRQALSVPPKPADGSVWSAASADGATPIYHDRMRGFLTASASGWVGPVNIDVEVWYDNQSDLERSGQVDKDEV
jgi:hypothetical protein